MNTSTFFKSVLAWAALFFAVSVVLQLLRRIVFPTVDAWTWFDIQAAIAAPAVLLAWWVSRKRRHDG